VTAIGAGGVITGVSVVVGVGVYSALPTNPVSVTGGTGTGATFNVTWKVQSLVITSGGSGYAPPPATAPPITFTGGGGTGAAATATVVVQCCLPINSAGSYALTASEPRYLSNTIMVTVATCEDVPPHVDHYPQITMTIKPDGPDVCCAS